MQLSQKQHIGNGVDKRGPTTRPLGQQRLNETHWQVYVNKKWVKEDESVTARKLESSRGIKDVFTFYANVVGFVRVAMALGATITIYMDCPFSTAALLLLSTLLDWIDGPLARKYNQTTIFGAGLDWFADLLVQMLIMAWWVILDPRVLPWQFLLMALEIALCMLEFTMTAAGWYPCRPSHGFDSFFYRVLDWINPGAGTWTRFGTALWLSFPVCCLSWCLHLSWRHVQLHPLTDALVWATKWALVPPSVLYWWGDLAQLCFFLSHWREQ